ncbi:putative Rossmann fold nucleotide-binding protein DprA/Smf involved in DNA uptake [Oxalobacteraceae bacterium GrIS 1.18]
MSEISDWIRLTATPGIGCDAAKRLLHAFGLPASIFAANYSDLRQVVSERQAKALCLPPNTATQALIERTSLWCAESCNTVLTLADKNYPAQLLEIPDPPTLLYIKGRAELLSKLSVAVVGSRNATAQGLVHAKQFSASLSMAGIVIVSGLALGIDAAAHQGGLEGAGSTIAVVGTGLDVIYPARNQALAHQIARQGCIVSEYPLGTLKWTHWARQFFREFKLHPFSSLQLVGAAPFSSIVLHLNSNHVDFSTAPLAAP